MVAQIGFGTTKRFLTIGCIALGFGWFGPFGSVAAAAGDGLAATLVRPAVIDEDGVQHPKTSSYPAEPMWPWSPSWPGQSSKPCRPR